MHRLSLYLFASSIALVSFFTLSSSMVLAQAQAPSGGTPCQGEIKAGICFPTSGSIGLSDKPVAVILGNFMFWLLSIVGVIAIIAFVISGLQYLTSVGDPKSAEKAKSNMINSIIGVVVALSGLIIIQALDALFTANTILF